MNLNRLIHRTTMSCIASISLPIRNYQFNLIRIRSGSEVHSSQTFKIKLSEKIIKHWVANFELVIALFFSVSHILLSFTVAICNKWNWKNKAFEWNVLDSNFEIKHASKVWHKIPFQYVTASFSLQWPIFTKEIEKKNAFQ